VKNIRLIVSSLAATAALTATGGYSQASAQTLAQDGSQALTSSLV
jgi:hypothetical protein